jgi:hypothetical protein
VVKVLVSTYSTAQESGTTTKSDRPARPLAGSGDEDADEEELLDVMDE